MLRRRLLLASRRLTLLLLAAVALAGCDKQSSAQTDEPAEWVKEANERSRKQRDDQANQKTQLPEPTRPTSAASENAATEQASPIERPLLWRVNGPNGPVYLFGTIHGGIPGLEWDDFPAETQEAVEDSEVLVLEANLDEVDPQQVAKLTMLPEGQSLKKILGEEHFKTLVAQTSSPAMMLELLQPWAAYAELSRVMVGEGRPVDDLVKVEGRVRKMEVVYLESVQEQLEILQAAVSADLVRDMLADLERQRELLDKMIAAYKRGDIDDLAAVAFDPREVESHPELYETLFTKRNRAWVSELEKHIERGHVFVAVGAGHLAGDKSVIKMLEDKGHTIERVPASEKPAAGKPASEKTAVEKTPEPAK